MPINEDLGTATGHLELESSGVDRGVNRATAALKTLEPVVRDNWWGLRNLGLAFTSIAGAVSGTFAVAVNSAVKWESAIAGVERTTYDASKTNEQNEQSLQRLSKELQYLATIKPTSASDLAAIAEEAGALGVASEDVAAFTAVIADLVATTDLTSDQATTGLARIAGPLGLGADQFKNLGSAILETGRSTAATEPEIVNMARRLTGAGAAAGLTAADVIGLSAAVVSLGPRAEAGSTAIQKTLFDMAKAVRENGSELAIFARVSGVSVEEFSRLFREDASEALTLFLEGLGRVKGDAATTQGILANLGITEARQIAALTQVASATKNVNNENVQLRNVLDLATQSFEEGTAITDIANRRYDTTAARLAILKNLFFNLAQTFGTAFLPVLNAGIAVLSAFAGGMEAIPGPVQAVLATMFALVGVIAAVGAGALLIVPRLVLVRSALLEIQASADLAAQAEARAAEASDAASAKAVAAKNRASAAATALAVAELRAANLRMAADQAAASEHDLAAARHIAADNKVIAAQAALDVAAAKSAAARASADLAQAELDKVIARRKGGVAAARAAETAASLKAAQAEAAEAIAADRLAAAELRATEAKLASATAGDRIVEASLKATAAEEGARIAADRLTVAREREAVAAATAAEAQAASATASGAAGAASGAAAAGGMTRMISTGSKLAKVGGILTAVLTVASIGVTIWGATHHKSSKALDEANKKTQDLIDSLGEEGAAFDDLAQDAQKANEAIKERNRAILSLMQANIEVVASQLAVKDAQKDYNEALEKSKDPLREIRKAELDLTKAQRARDAALRDLDAAVKKQSRARQDQLDDLADAEDKVKDAQDNRLDSLDKIKDLEEELTKLREGPSADKLRDATDKLARAQYNLLKSTQKVADSEWYLNYLREEGASARDITEAELELQDARLDVNETNANISDDEKELAKLREGADLDAIAAKERDLAKARRDSEKALRDIADAEAEAKQLREDVANDTAYKDATREVEDAYIGVADALDNVADKEADLKKVRDKDYTLDLAKAELALEQAYIRQATASADLRKQQALARGDIVTTKDEANFLADALDGVADKVGGPLATKLRGYAAELRKAIPEKVTTEVGATVDDKSLEDAKAKLKKAQEDAAKDAKKNSPSLWETVGEAVGGALGSVAGAAIAGAIAGSVVPGLGTVAGLIVGAIGGLAGGILGAIIGKWLGPIIPTIIAWVPGAAEALTSWIGDLDDKVKDGMQSFTDSIMSFISELPGKIGYALGLVIGTVLKFLIEDLPRIVTETLPQWIENIVNFFKQLPGKIGTALESLLNTITQQFWRIFAEIVGFIARTGPAILEFFTSLPGKALDAMSGWGSSIGNFLNTITQVFVQKAGEFIGGLLLGMEQAFPGITEKLKGVLWSVVGFFSNAGTWLLQAGKDIIGGMIQGIREKMNGLPTIIKELLKATIPDPLEKFFGISSPSKLMMGYGNYIGEGLAIGLEQASKVIEDAAAKMYAVASPDERASIDALMSPRSAGPAIAEQVLARTPMMAGSGTTASVPSATGDNFNITVRQEATAEDILNEANWRRRAKRR